MLILLNVSSVFSDDDFFNFEIEKYSEKLNKIKFFPVLEKNGGEFKVGAGFKISDFLKRHQIFGHLSYGTSSYKLNGQFDIIEHKYRSTLHLRIYEKVKLKSYYNYDFHELKKGAWLNIIVPVTVNNVLGIYLVGEKYESLFLKLPANIPLPFLGQENKISLYYKYKWYKNEDPLGILPVSGSELRTEFGYSGNSIGSDISYIETKFYWEQYFKLSRINNVIKLKTDIARTLKYYDYPSYRFTPEFKQLRGLVNDNLRGDNYFVFSFDYRHPMGDINTNLLFMWFYKYFISFFIDSGKWWNEHYNENEFQYTTGIETVIKTGISGKLPGLIRIGVGKEINLEKNNPSGYIFLEYDF